LDKQGELRPAHLRSSRFLVNLPARLEIRFGRDGKAGLSSQKAPGSPFGTNDP